MWYTENIGVTFCDNVYNYVSLAVIFDWLIAPLFIGVIIYVHTSLSLEQLTCLPYLWMVQARTRHMIGTLSVPSTIIARTQYCWEITCFSVRQPSGCRNQEATCQMDPEASLVAELGIMQFLNGNKAAGYWEITQFPPPHFCTDFGTGPGIMQATKVTFSKSSNLLARIAWFTCYT